MIKSDENELLNKALYTFKEIGEVEQVLVNWEALPDADKTWTKFKEHFTKEFLDRRKHFNIEAKGAGFESTANAQEHQWKRPTTWKKWQW